MENHDMHNDFPQQTPAPQPVPTPSPTPVQSQYVQQPQYIQQPQYVQPPYPVYQQPYVQPTNTPKPQQPLYPVAAVVLMCIAFFTRLLFILDLEDPNIENFKHLSVTAILLLVGFVCFIVSFSANNNKTAFIAGIGSLLWAAPFVVFLIEFTESGADFRLVHLFYVSYTIGFILWALGFFIPSAVASRILRTIGVFWLMMIETFFVFCYIDTVKASVFIEILLLPALLIDLPRYLAILFYHPYHKKINK